MIKTILAIIISVTFFGVLFFIIVRNLLKRKIDQLVQEEKERKKLNRRVRAVNWVMRFVWGKGMLFSDQEIDEEIDIQFERDEWN